MEGAMTPAPIQPVFCPEYTNDAQLNEHQRRHLYLAMTGYIAGPMPLPRFFRDYFPGAKIDDDEDKTSGNYEAFRNAKKETEMYVPWASAMQQEYLPANTMIFISSDSTLNPYNLKPDHAFKVPPHDQVLPLDPDPGAVLVQIVKAPYDFMEMDLTVETKHGDEVMPFLLVWAPRASIESKDGGSARGQLGLYAAKHLAHQHRVAVYQVILNGKYAQIVRWDRAGAVVSAAFNPTTEPWIPRLVRAYHQMDRLGRGFDGTVQPATDAETTHYRKVIASWSIGVQMKAGNKLRILNHLAANKKWPVEKVAVHDEDAPDKMRYVLTSQPFYVGHGSLGYGLRHYLAVDPHGKHVFTMRDSWRVEGTRSEHATYKMLLDAEVVHTFQVKSGGDVVDPGETTPQRTTSQDVATSPANASWRQPGCHGPPMMHARVHQRHLEPVGFPVHSVQSCRELLMVFRDALHAVKDVWEKLGLMHGDITPNSIQYVLKEGGGLAGILSGWHNAHRYGERAPYTAATSQFMSLRLMKDGDLTPELIDEVESWFWSFVYSALLYVDSKNDSILMQDGDFFSACMEKVTKDGKIAPIDYMRKQSYLLDELHNVEFTCPAFSEIFRLFAKAWRNYYGLLSVDPEFRGPQFAEITSMVSSPQWFLNQIDLALKKAGWVTGSTIRGPSRDQLSKNDQPFVSQALRVKGACSSAAGGGVPDIEVVSSVGKSTAANRVIRKLGSMAFQTGTKRPADGDPRAVDDKENEDMSVHPPVLVAPPARMAPDEVARRTRKLNNLPPQIPAQLPGPTPVPVPLAPGDSALTVPDDADVQMTAASALPQAPSSTAQDVLQHISAPQTPKRKKGGFLQKVRDTVTPKKTKEAAQPLSPVKAKTPMRGLVRRMRGKGK
ncbi:hypothetical protein PsYK624_082270 [Phanerochaete sordida]|uniref:Fungal-type protein kinase domain-containing protein n=1 Tax=Phanerochaete sordida TaxID=48140 RepID=A0A9P3GE44_9APHY|nr:hypothetical protein PsYK624_082270 [Phanerochaete sordida]